MKILLITDYYPPDRLGGVGLVARHLKRSYENMGHQVFVLTTGDKYEEIGDNRVIRSSPSLHWGVIVNNVRALQLVRREDFDFIHMHHASSTLFLAGRQILGSFPFVLNTLHASYLSLAREIRTVRVAGHTFRPRLREYVEKFVFGPVHVVLDAIGYCLADHVTVLTEQVRDDLLDTFGKLFPTTQVSIIPNAGPSTDDTGWACCSQGLRKPDIEEWIGDRAVIAYVGAFRIVKRVQNLLVAFQRVVDRKSDAVLLLIGSGRGYEDSLRGLADELSISDNVVFLGRVPHQDIPYFLRLTDILCLLSCYEGGGPAPLALLEAMQCGTAVVATDRCGIRELMGDGECGVLVPVDDIEATAEALRGLIDDPERRNMLGRAARERVTHYQWGQIAKRYLELVPEEGEANPAAAGSGRNDLAVS